jgi:hypothetical protein
VDQTAISTGSGRQRLEGRLLFLGKDGQGDLVGGAVDTVARLPEDPLQELGVGIGQGGQGARAVQERAAKVAHA